MSDLMPENTSEIRVFQNYGVPIKLADNPQITINLNQNGVIQLNIPSAGIGPDPISAENTVLQDWLNSLTFASENGIKEVFYTAWEFEDKNALKKFLESLDRKEFEIIYS